MAITVQIEDEHGKREGDLWMHRESTTLLDREHHGTSCLRFIDPYADTVFNQLQIPVLVGAA